MEAAAALIHTDAAITACSVDEACDIDEDDADIDEDDADDAEDDAKTTSSNHADKVRSGLTGVDKLLNHTPASTRLYRSNFGLTLAIWTFFKILWTWKYEGDDGSAAPKLPFHVYEQYLVTKGISSKEFSEQQLADQCASCPMCDDMARFVNSTKVMICNNVTIGPCISFYIHSISVSFIWWATQNLNINIAPLEFTKYIDILTHAYQCISFAVHSLASVAMMCGDRGPKLMNEQQSLNLLLLQKARAEMAKAAGMCKDNIPTCKFIAFATWLYRATELGYLDGIPEEIIQNLFALFPKYEADGTTLAADHPLHKIKMFADLTTVICGSSLSEFRKWIGRQLARCHLIAVHASAIVYKKCESSQFTFEYVKQSLDSSGFVTSILDDMLGPKNANPPNYFRDRVRDDLVIKLAKKQLVGVWKERNVYELKE